MAPLVMLSAALSVREPALPTSSVWLLLAIAMAPELAVPATSRVEATLLAMASVRPLTLPMRSSVPPLAITSPLPLIVAAVTLP